MASENWSKKYHQIRKDVSYIEKTYGQVYDFCGAWCNNQMFQKLLDSPNLKTAVNLYKDMIYYYFSIGYEGAGTPRKLPENDKKLRKIKERWLIDRMNY
ncbi:hypothetical protein PP175_28230 (plasmid) [Aneurinibacillus sp. Ricciae_BoGa-3]|uniref:hypothetical protein n=1 Tax=Aneurinibacillus sp. Ricciae_BoGa-3 TaxID=3022697 RepID=UPI00233FA251|nr:hypothetical protein [Aneurinibacillus sp. Ricciae_BoGa-3]WCK57079.1 hypothetical protein PP175_28230 [Aneurinibacillus sp. Ricciae_BoGa-3]